MVGGEAHIGGHVVLGLVHEAGKLWQLGAELVDDPAPLGLSGPGAVLGEGGRHKAETTRRLLGVRYMLEGSVQRDQSRVRVDAQLIDADSGAHLWADRFEEEVADLFKLQDQVVARLANPLGWN
jgi:hypothetical protein